MTFTTQLRMCYTFIILIAIFILKFPLKILILLPYHYNQYSLFYNKKGIRNTRSKVNKECSP